MRKGFGFRAMITAYTGVWLAMLLALNVFVFNCLARNMLVWSEGGQFPWFWEHFAVPMIGGLRGCVPRMFGPNWSTFVVWGILYLWPVANLAFVCLCKDHDRARWGLLYSSAGYGLFFFAVVLGVALGLAAPFVYL
jgi:hypothetical protein